MVELPNESYLAGVEGCCECDQLGGYDHAVLRL